MEHGDCRRFASLRYLGFLSFRADGVEILVIEVLYRSVNLNYGVCDGCNIVGT